MTDETQFSVVGDTRKNAELKGYGKNNHGEKVYEKGVRA